MSTNLAVGGRLAALSAVLILATAALPVGAETVYVDCTGQTPGAFTSITAAVGSLTGPAPTSGAWDYVLLESDCTENVVLTTARRLWIAPAWDSCPWAGCTGNGLPAQIVAASPGSDVVSVEGPQDVALVHLSLSGGTHGLSASGRANVTLFGVVARDNTSSGIAIGTGAFVQMNEGGANDNGRYGVEVGLDGAIAMQGELPWMAGQRLVVSGNALGGLLVDRGSLYSSTGTTVENNLGPGIVSYGGDWGFGDYRTESLIQGNVGGAFLSEGSQMSFWGGLVLRGNGSFGVYVEGSSHATFFGVGNGLPEGKNAPIVEGHSRVGVHVAMNSQAAFHGPVQVRDNGSPYEKASAGVVVDGNSQASFAADGTNGAEGPPSVSHNFGPAIFADLNSSIDARDLVARANRGEGVQLLHQSVAYLDPNARIDLNAGGTLTCDSTSLAIAEEIHRDRRCHNIERPREPRPPRPPQPR